MNITETQIANNIASLKFNLICKFKENLIDLSNCYDSFYNYLKCLYDLKLITSKDLNTLSNNFSDEIIEIETIRIQGGECNE